MLYDEHGCAKANAMAAPDQNVLNFHKKSHIMVNIKRMKDKYIKISSEKKEKLKKKKKKFIMKRKQNKTKRRGEILITGESYL